MSSARFQNKAHAISVYALLATFPLCIAMQVLRFSGHPNAILNVSRAGVICLMAAGITALYIPEKDAWMRIIGRASNVGLIMVCLFIFYLDLRRFAPLP